MLTLDELANRWRADAMTLRKRGCVSQAELLESCAHELEAARDEALAVPRPKQWSPF